MEGGTGAHEALRAASAVPTQNSGPIWDKPGGNQTRLPASAQGLVCGFFTAFPAAGEGGAWEQEGGRRWPGGRPSGRKDYGLF